jgi:CHAD domain-containing protein
MGDQGISLRKYVEVLHPIHAVLELNKMTTYSPWNELTARKGKFD